MIKANPPHSFHLISLKTILKLSTYLQTADMLAFLISHKYITWLPYTIFLEMAKKHIKYINPSEHV
jgi:hypothetical protein